MIAAVIAGQHVLELREVPSPVPLADQVVVDIALCGVCGTDIHAYQSGRPYNPAICGHEWVGTVSGCGAEVKRVGDGDRVVVAVPPPCGGCAACRAGQTRYCSAVFLAATGRDVRDPQHGGFASQLAVRANRVVPAHALLNDVEAAQVEPATVTFHAVKASALRLGDVAVIQGAGPIGLLTMQWVKAFGAAEVIVIEPNEQRRQLAISLGATASMAPGDEASEFVRAHTKGLGADIVYECVGRGFAVQAAVDLARRGGAVCLIGYPDTDATINPGMWLIKEISLTASLAYTHEEFDQAMAMMADGRVRVASMHSSTVSLSQLGDALADLASGQSTQSKVLVNPNL
jgi:(R,R)-butanediol dehydrogenase / meso-butanediol dehydrogenase / diacetyl reductase